MGDCTVPSEEYRSPSIVSSGLQVCDLGYYLTFVKYSVYFFENYTLEFYEDYFIIIYTAVMIIQFVTCKTLLSALKSSLFI